MPQNSNRLFVTYSTDDIHNSEGGREQKDERVRKMEVPGGFSPQEVMDERRGKGRICFAINELLWYRHSLLYGAEKKAEKEREQERNMDKKT
jgi:hypothetical protein